MRGLGDGHDKREIDNDHPPRILKAEISGIFPCLRDRAAIGVRARTGRYHLVALSALDPVFVSVISTIQSGHTAPSLYIDVLRVQIRVEVLLSTSISTGPVKDCDDAVHTRASKRHE